MQMSKMSQKPYKYFFFELLSGDSTRTSDL